MKENIVKAYEYARERYAAVGVDTEAAIERFNRLPISMNSWQLDDIKGFINPSNNSGGGVMVTGNYPGAATTFDELIQDMDFVLDLLPGKKKINLQSNQVSFTETGLDLDTLEPRHFQAYVDWAKQRGIGLNISPSVAGHKMVKDDFSLSSPDPAIRDFWIEHFVRCSEIGEYLGRELNWRCVTDYWIPDGYKDYPADQYAPRVRLAAALDTIFERLGEQKHNVNVLEGKVFGVSLEAYTVGSHDFYVGYAASRKKALCIDIGHYNPQEDIATKLSALKLVCPEMMLHITRPMRWDSDHVPLLDDLTQSMTNEIIRNNWDDSIHIGTDYFDASINRIAACVLGMRSIQKAVLRPMLENTAEIREAEKEGNYAKRLALMEEFKTLPFNLVYDYICETAGVPIGTDWIKEVMQYEKDVLLKR